MADLAGGGLRQRLRSAGTTGLGPGLRLAAMLALTTATALAGAWAALEASPWTAAWLGFEYHGTSVSLGAGVWAAWLVAAVVQGVAPGRWTRLAIGLALVLTVAVVPLAGVVGHYRPPLFVLLAQAGLGLVALGVPGRLSLGLRLLPLAGAVAAFPVVVALGSGQDGFSSYYGWLATQILPSAGIALLVVTSLAGLLRAARGEPGVAWALLLLSYPIGLLWLYPLAEEIAGLLYDGGASATWATLALAVNVLSAAAAMILVSAALTARRRHAHTHATAAAATATATATAGRCAACGSPTGS